MRENMSLDKICIWPKSKENCSEEKEASSRKIREKLLAVLRLFRKIAGRKHVSLIEAFENEHYCWGRWKAGGDVAGVAEIDNGDGHGVASFEYTSTPWLSPPLHCRPWVGSLPSSFDFPIFCFPLHFILTCVGDVLKAFIFPWLLWKFYLEIILK